MFPDLPGDQQTGAGQQLQLGVGDLHPGEDEVHHGDREAEHVWPGLLLLADRHEPAAQLVSHLIVSHSVRMLQLSSSEILSGLLAGLVARHTPSLLPSLLPSPPPRNGPVTCYQLQDTAHSLSLFTLNIFPGKTTNAYF